MFSANVDVRTARKRPNHIASRENWQFDDIVAFRGRLIGLYVASNRQMFARGANVEVQKNVVFLRSPSKCDKMKAKIGAVFAREREVCGEKQKDRTNSKEMQKHARFFRAGA